MVPTLSRPRRQRGHLHAPVVSGAILLASLVLAATASVGFASNVAPIITHNNAECDNVDGGAGWLQMVIDDAGRAGPWVSADGALVVTLSFHSVSENTPAVVDWSSNIGVEGLVVRGGQTGDNFYRYDPPATSDTYIMADASGTSQISNLNFCYQLGGPTPRPTPTPTPTSGSGSGLPDAATSLFDSPLLAGALILVGISSLLALPVIDAVVARRRRPD